MIFFDYLNQTFFDDEIHETIPEIAQAISETQHHEFLIALNNGAKITKDLEVMLRPSLAHVWLPEKQVWLLDEAAQKAEFQAACAVKIAELNTIAQDFINKKTGLDKVPEFEVQTWVIQGAEAKAWAADNTVATPILDQIATARGVSADVLKQAALRKTQAYEALTALVAGQRQALQTQIEAAKTLDELGAIEIAFRLPESGVAS